MGKKKGFHCHSCGLPCEIFKKGRKHKVLVCPKCGVLATNPISWAKAGEGAALGATLGSVVPGIGTGIGGAVGGIVGGVSGLFKKGSKRTAPKEVFDAQEHRRLSSFEKAVLLEAAERR